MRAAVEAIYKVNVVKINTMVHKSRTKRNKHGWTGGKLTKPLAGQLKDLPRVRYIREFRLDTPGDLTVGKVLTAPDVFKDIKAVVGKVEGPTFSYTHREGMPNMNLSEAQIDALVAYLETLE